MVTVSDIIHCLDEIAPPSIAEPWDNVGLLIGDRNRLVRSLLIALDPTNRLLDEALEVGADTVITHHPIILKPLPLIDTAEPTGSLLEKALTSRLNVLACHTNFDSAQHGVNDTLAELLGLVELEPLVQSDPRRADGSGLGRIGRFPATLAGNDFIARVLHVLDLESCQTAGPLPPSIRTVALCGGSGSDLAELARQRGADVYLSAEIKHHVARWAEQCGFCVIDGTHYATEKPAVHRLARAIREYARRQGWDVTVHETATESHPFQRVTKTSESNQQTTGEAS